MIDTHTCRYIYYDVGATPDAGIRTDSSGAFTANITFTLQYNGTAIVTAIDELGNVATAEFLVYGSWIPEGLSFGVAVILSALAVIVATLVFRKRSKIYK